MGVANLFFSPKKIPEGEAARFTENLPTEGNHKTRICTVKNLIFNRGKSRKEKQLGSPKNFLPRKTTKSGSSR